VCLLVTFSFCITDFILISGNSFTIRRSVTEALLGDKRKGTLILSFVLYFVMQVFRGYHFTYLVRLQNKYSNKASKGHDLLEILKTLYGLIFCIVRNNVFDIAEQSKKNVELWQC
jgi:hypothetical protein